MKERWPGEAQLKDAIDNACRNYLSAYVEADPDDEYDAESSPILVGWVLGIQTLGRDEHEEEDVDGLVSVVAEGVTTYAAIGITETLSHWYREDGT